MKLYSVPSISYKTGIYHWLLGKIAGEIQQHNLCSYLQFFFYFFAVDVFLNILTHEAPKMKIFEFANSIDQSSI